MALPIEAAGGEQGVGALNIARMDDYWLGGRHHREVDRDFADRVAITAPYVPYLVRAQRKLLRRMVRYLMDQGVRQFLDLGSGLPTAGHVHEIAQDKDPAARVVYVDRDSSIVDDCHQLLAGNDNAALLDTDIREPGTVLDVLRARCLLDLSEPVAVLAIAILQHIPDSDDPAGMITAYLDATCPGSYLALTHYGPDEHLMTGITMFSQMKFGRPPDVTFRDRTSVALFFSGLELVEPGIVPIVDWRPDPTDDPGINPERHPIFAGVGRKP
ncbi:MAG TPA: SAM-dependent methyltransferase [Actinophytocola sp.]|uniref:SAM-dependent methyltransferase n=1 Tax=Actinophytocola sp. TaxID=1872138 RepID=UPI002DDD9ADB|nr:SAM-dependent methyltransferase [Actinophytocola sp.]HEV2778248.1 SAM-dependent methyltransferase [Actinophytocola sp.]